MWHYQSYNFTNIIWIPFVGNQSEIYALNILQMILDSMLFNPYAMNLISKRRILLFSSVLNINRGLPRRMTTDIVYDEICVHSETSIVTKSHGNNICIGNTVKGVVKIAKMQRQIMLPVMVIE